MTTLLVTYRRPEGGDEALATFERRYRDEHVAAIERQDPSLCVEPGCDDLRHVDLLGAIVRSGIRCYAHQVSAERRKKAEANRARVRAFRARKVAEARS